MDNIDRDFFEYFFGPEYAKAFSKDSAYRDKKDSNAEAVTELFNLLFNTTKNK